MKRKIVAFSMLVFMAAIAIGGILALVAFAGGCPPNETCPPDTIPGWKECKRNQCDSYADDGYCVFCYVVPRQ